MNGQELADADGTQLVGFFAAGECACVSVHGANRLGTNSLLEASLFGLRAGCSLAEFVLGGAALQPAYEQAQARQQARLAHLLDGEGTESVGAIAAELKDTMTQSVGVFRDAARLAQAQETVKSLQQRFAKARSRDRSKRCITDLLATIETEHLLTFAEVVVDSALNRTESRGAHYRTDHAKRDDEQWLKHTLAFKGEDAPELDYKPVTIFWDRYPPQERKY